MLQLAPEGPGNVQSCVVRRFSILFPFASMDHCMATPNGVTLAPGMFSMHSGVMGIAHLYCTSLLNDLLSALMLSVVWADLWFPQSRNARILVIRSCSGMSINGYVTPCLMMSTKAVL